MMQEKIVRKYSQSTVKESTFEILWCFSLQVPKHVLSKIPNWIYVNQQTNQLSNCKPSFGFVFWKIGTPE